MKITVRIDESFHPTNMVGLELGQLVRVEATIEEQQYDRYYNIAQWPGNDKGLSIPVGDDCIVSIEILP